MNTAKNVFEMVKPMMRNCWEKFYINQKTNQNLQLQKSDDDNYVLTWDEFEEITKVKTDLVNARKNLNQTLSDARSMEVAVLNLHTLERKYIMLLENIKSLGKHCTSEQLARWSLLQKNRF